jgi:hypothetical protein
MADDNGIPVLDDRYFFRFLTEQDHYATFSLD